MEYQESPTWLRAADNHNIAAHNDSFFSNVGRSISNAPDAILVSAASGLNSLYNSGVAVANVFRSDETQLAYNDTQEWITSFDDNLGKYYEENKEFADIAGFIGTSLIPGMVGVKALGAGQKALQAASAGQVGTNMSRATGLLAPAMRTAVQRQGAELAARSQTWSLFNRNTLGVIGRGAQQGVLEGVAFEAAVMATMFKSPIFDDMDTMDMVKNMGIGIAIGGGVGTIIGGAASYFGTARLLKNADARQQEFATAATPYIKGAYDEADRVVASAFDRDAVSLPVTSDQVLARKIAQGESGASISDEAVMAEVRQLNSLREQNLEKLNNTVRTNIRGLYRSPKAAQKDDTFGNFAADVFGKENFQNTSSVFERMRQFVRVGEDSVHDKLVKQVAREQKVSKAEAAKLVGNDSTAYIQLHSGGIGDVLDEAPGTFTRLADSRTPAEISKFVKSKKFSPKKGWDFKAKLDPRDAEARWLWARNLTKPLDKTQVVNSHDLPLLEKAVRDGNDNLMVVLPDGNVTTLSGTDEIAQFYRQSQTEVASAQIAYGNPVGNIELLSDIRADALQGASKLDAADPRNFSAQASYAEELGQRLGVQITPADLHLRPKYMKASYANAVTDEDQNILRGMQAIKYQQKLYQQDADKAVASYLGEGATAFIPYNEEALRRTWRGGTGQGVYTNAGGTYGSTESITSHNGTIVSHLERKKMRELRESMDNNLQIMLTDPKVAVRFSAINEQVANQVEKFVLNSDGTALIPRKMRDYLDEIAAGNAQAKRPVLAEGTPDEIRLVLADGDTRLANIVAQHIELSARRNENFSALAAAQGNTNRKFGDTYYPVRQDPRQYKHVAFVVDPSISGVGHKRMILARDGKELEELISKVPKQYKVVRKQQAEEFYAASGDWMYDRTLHENYLDIDLNSRGIRSNFFPQTDPQQIADTYLQHHIRSENALFREAVAVKFQPFINEMERLGSIYAQTHASSTEAAARLAVSTKNNPYMAQVKSLFNLSRLEDAPNWWVSANRALDSVVSKAWNGVESITRNARLGEQERIDLINNTFNEVGFKSAYYDAATNVLANSKVPQGVLTGFVRKANAFLTSTILRLDAFNALNNKLGNQIIMSAEINSLTRAIREADANSAGELAELSRLAVPGSGGDTILSGPKLIANAYRLLHGEGREQLIKQLDEHGLVPDLTDQYYKSLDAMTLSGAETARDLTRKSEQLSAAWNKFVEKGSRVTGNEWAERMNRLTSAVVMKQITDMAQKAGVIDEATSWAYINTFVNRVNGVVRAAERPLMFQGPIGQAVGLFQSYQFNLIQQTLRLIGEGRGKSVAMLAGMQASIYGASSLPGFNLINHSLLGTASGNPNHEDLYSVSQALFGKEGSEWLMYGAPSNILNMSLYTRGNTNPRVWHIVPNPTNPEDIPFISAFSSAIGSAKGAVTSVANGAPIWESVLSGLEHSGLSRPLAGLAATARAFTNDGVAYTTQRSGNFLYENDLVSLATLGRLAGAKPMDEAVMQNNYFRIQAYASADRNKRNELGKAIRTTIQAGGVPDTESINNFAERYAARGGNVQNFNQYWMSQYRNATTSQAEQLSQRLTNPYGRQMQYLMGGMESNEVGL